jgi:hypothetical protein
MNQWANAPSRGSAAASAETDDLDRSGNAILSALKEAARLANSDYERVCDVTRDLSNKVRATEERVQELASAARLWQDRATTAEKWLHDIHKEVKGKFFGKPAEANASNRP